VDMFKLIFLVVAQLLPPGLRELKVKMGHSGGIRGFRDITLILGILRV
jgi:hypothetical protein